MGVSKALILVVAIQLVLTGCLELEEEPEEEIEPEKEKNYAFKSFIFTNNHTAASNGTSDFLLYLENQGDVNDTFELEAKEPTVGLKLELEFSQVTLKVNESTAIIIHANTTEAPNGTAGARLTITSKGNSSVNQDLSLELWIEEDLGENMSDEDEVGVFYLGTHVDGVLFDTNFEAVAKNNSMPRDSGMGHHYNIFDVSPSIEEANVIEGFKEPLTSMRLEETTVVRIPPEKAYGNSGDHPLAGETLIFQIFLAEKY